MILITGIAYGFLLSAPTCISTGLSQASFMCVNWMKIFITTCLCVIWVDCCHLDTGCIPLELNVFKVL